MAINMENEVTPKGNAHPTFTEDEVAELLESALEMFTDEELQDDKVMMKELRYFLGLPDRSLLALIKGAREIRELRGRRIPVWAQPFQNH